VDAIQVCSGIHGKTLGMILEAESALQIVAAATSLQFPPEQGA